MSARTLLSSKPRLLGIGCAVALTALVATAFSHKTMTVSIGGRPATIRVNRLTGTTEELIRDGNGRAIWREVQAANSVPRVPLGLAIDPVDLDIVDERRSGSRVQIALRNRSKVSLSEVTVRFERRPSASRRVDPETGLVDLGANYDGLFLSRPRTITPKDGASIAPGTTGILESFEMDEGHTYSIIDARSRP
jgi:hypothetical protein